VDVLARRGEVPIASVAVINGLTVPSCIIRDAIARRVGALKDVLVQARVSISSRMVEMFVTQFEHEKALMMRGNLDRERDCLPSGVSTHWLANKP